MFTKIKINEIDYSIYLRWFSEFTRDIPINRSFTLKLRLKLARIELNNVVGKEKIFHLNILRDVMSIITGGSKRTENFVIDGNAINNEDNLVYENWKNQVKLFLQNS